MSRYDNVSGITTETDNLFPPCDFCGSKSIGETYQGGTNIVWSLCPAVPCFYAAVAQKQRIFAGLVDCEETRRHALQWINRDKKK